MKHGTSSALVALSLLCTADSVLAQGIEMLQCSLALQGRIAWDYQGSTVWENANLERLCRGGRGAEPALCFNRIMHGGVDWGGGTRWQWENATIVCQGSQSASATVGCFQAQRAAGLDWRSAADRCSPAMIGSAARAVRPAPPPAPLVIPAEVPTRNWVLEVDVDSRKSNGDAWDAFGGAPDVSLCTRSAIGEDCGGSTRFQDSFHGTFTRRVPSVFTVYLRDLDVAENDAIGQCVIDHPGTFECGSARVTARDPIGDLVTAIATNRPIPRADRPQSQPVEYGSTPTPPPPPPPPPRPAGIASAAAFAEMQAAVDATMLDSQKVDVVRDLLSGGARMFTSEQAASLMRSAAMDSVRIDIGALLLPRLTDPENVYRLTQTFSLPYSASMFRDRVGLSAR